MGTKNILKKMNYIDKKMMNRQQRRKLERERKKKIKEVMNKNSCGIYSSTENQ